MIRTFARWAALSSQVAVMQVLVQGLGAITGLVLIRALNKDEYAWFTLAGSMLATINLLADGGISSALTSIGGRLYQNISEFSRLLADGRRMAVRLGLLGTALSVPFFWHLYARLGTPPASAVAMIGMAILGVVPSIFSALMSVALRLHARAQQTQVAEILGVCVRLTFSVLLLWIGSGDARVWFAGTLLAAAAQAWLIKRQTHEFADSSLATTGHSREIAAFVRALYANQLFFCIQGQIATWLIGYFAGVSQVADLGALSRLAVLFTAVSALYIQLVVPSLARIQDAYTLRLRFMLAIAVAFGSTASIVVAAALQPNLFLWLLGTKYSDLGPELILSLSSQGVSMITGICWGLMVARGWVRYAWVNIPISCLGYIIGALLLPLNTVAGVLKMNMVATALLLTWVLLRCWRQLALFQGSKSQL